MNPLLLVFVICALIPTVHGATSSSVEWCYHRPHCDDTQWSTLFPEYCNHSRQSPIDIISANATPDPSLTPFILHNFDNSSALDKIMNTGKTVKVTMKSDVRISGGGLSEPYDTLQFHLHWGNGSATMGSEHAVDGKRYPMELHIVNAKSSYNGNTTLAVADHEGLAALGFFIEAMSGNATNSPASWDTLTAYLSNITEKDQYVKVKGDFSLDQLLAGVDRSKYYRYLGSLTTPACNEAVVWTVFKDTIKVSKDLIDLFSTTVRIGNESSPLMVDVYRDLQPNQEFNVTTTLTPTPTPTPTTTPSSASKTCLSLGLLSLSLLMMKGST